MDTETPSDLVRVAQTMGGVVVRLDLMTQAQQDVLSRLTALEGRGALSPETAAELEARHATEMVRRQDHEALIKQLRNAQVTSLIGIPAGLIIGGLANAFLMPHVTTFIQHLHG